MENNKLIYATAARKAILRADPRLAYVIDSIPAVDAVEVVRCKDCKYWEEYDGEMFCCCYANLMTDTAPNDFCSYGERGASE